MEHQMRGSAGALALMEPGEPLMLWCGCELTAGGAVVQWCSCVAYADGAVANWLRSGAAARRLALMMHLASGSDGAMQELPGGMTVAMRMAWHLADR